MSRIRGRGNMETELTLIGILRRERITGWRRHIQLRIVECGLRNGYALQMRRAERRKREFRVKPDFVFPKLRVAVFVDGCFWHGCPQHCNQPAHNRTFWRKKLAGNVARDRLVTRVLRRNGWRVLRLWEHELARKRRARLVAKLWRIRGFLT